MSACGNFVAEWLTELEAKNRAEGKAEGTAKGKVKGRRLALTGQVRLRFGALSDVTRARLDAADEASLDLWTERILVAATLDELFAG